jgi:hypothetical protein
MHAAAPQGKLHFVLEHVRMRHNGCRAPQMWVYGGWSEAYEQSLGDMHVLHLADDAPLRWEQVAPGGFEMEARSWHSVGVYKGQMLLYGDKGECAQSVANMRTVFVFDFATRRWRTQVCRGTPACAALQLARVNARFECMAGVRRLLHTQLCSADAQKRRCTAVHP